MRVTLHEMNEFLRRAYRAAVKSLLRPYIRRELPGWGFLYRNFVGDYRRDALWRDHRPEWVRGKLHQYEMSVRIGGWSNRATYFLERFYDLPTQLLLKLILKPGDVFVDVGANEGMISLLAARLVGPQGRVVAFEPNPVPRKIMEGNIRRNRITNVEVRASGLGDIPGELRLFVPDVNTGEGTFTELAGVPGTAITCPVVIGDDALRGLRPRAIKIDVEGFESRVLAGLRETLARDRPIVCIEMNAGHLARDGSSLEAVARLLESLGYTGRRLGVERRGMTQHLIATDRPAVWEDGDYVWTQGVDSTAISANARNL
jgi:FkbM family methyltransferase